MRTITAFCFSFVLSLGCDNSNDGGGGGGDGDGDGDGDGADAAPDAEGPPMVVVTGTVVDFETGEPLAVDPSITSLGLTPEPMIEMDGSSFTLTDVLVNSTFHLLVSAPDHRTTVGAAVTVAEEDVEGVSASVVSEAYLTALADAFAVDETIAGVVLARAVDDTGAPRAGIPAAAFELAAEQPVAGPFFLDAELQADPGLEQTSASGWVVYFEVAPGLNAITAAVDSGYVMDMPSTPIEDGAATVAQIIVTEGELVLPTNISFTEDVIAVFETRGCADCHSGNGPGKDLANLTLDGGTNMIYNELHDPATNEGQRVNLDIPETSLILRMPSAEDPPDMHPTIVFASPNDPDYLTLLVWVREGATNP